MKYKISTLSEQNLDALVHLYKVVFGNVVTLDFVKRKFNSHYLGKSHFGHLAFFNDQPIAFHGAVPFRMQYNDGIEIGAQYGDAMTNPKHTGQGLFTELGQRTDEQLKEAGIHFVWGFPNQNSEYGYVHKLDWQSQERMQGFKIFTRRKRVAKLLHRISNRFLKQLLEQLDKYIVSDLNEGSLSQETEIVTTVRDREFYLYKSYGGNLAVRFDEAIFWIKLRSALLVGDVIAPSKKAFAGGLDQLIDIATKHQVGEIIFQTSPNTILSEWISDRADAYFDSWMVGYKPFATNFPLQKLKLTFGDLDTF